MEAIIDIVAYVIGIPLVGLGLYLLLGTIYLMLKEFIRLIKGEELQTKKQTSLDHDHTRY